MNVMNVFNGMSIGSMALEDLGLTVNESYISEIDKYANQASEALFPESIQLGSVIDWSDWDVDWSSIDLLMGGPPCQAFSIAGNRLAFDDDRGLLTKTYFEIINHGKPKAVFMENVPGMLSAGGGEVFKYVLKEFNNCGYAVDFIEINAELLSAQSRKRVYLVGKLIDDCQGMEYTSDFKNTKIIMFDSGISQPVDQGILLKDIIESGIVSRDKSQTILSTIYKENAKSMIKRKKYGLLVFEGTGDLNPIDDLLTYESMYRKFTPRECMRLQTIPERHINTLLSAGISNTQLYKMTGNAWNMKVISHILKSLI